MVPSLPNYPVNSPIVFAVHVFFIRPTIEPAGAQLWVDGEQVRFKRGADLGLSFRSHEIKIVPAVDPSPADFKTLPYQFTIGRFSLMRGIFRNKDAARWTPLYPVALRRHLKDSTVELKRYGGLFEGILESQELTNVQLHKGYLRVLNDGNELATVYLPMGRYAICELMSDGRSCQELGVTVLDQDNAVLELASQPCPALP